MMLSCIFNEVTGATVCCVVAVHDKILQSDMACMTAELSQQLTRILATDG